MLWTFTFGISCLKVSLIFCNLKGIGLVVSVELWLRWSYPSPIKGALFKTVDCFLSKTAVVGDISTRSKFFDCCNDNTSLELNILKLLRIDIFFLAWNVIYLLNYHRCTIFLYLLFFPAREISCFEYSGWCF